MPRITKSLIMGERVPAKEFKLVPPDRSIVIERMEEHKRVLSIMGITDLSTLGTLSISGAVIPDAGVLTPRRRGLIEPLFEDILFNSAIRATPGVKPKLTTFRGWDARTLQMEKIGGKGKLLKAKHFPFFSKTSTGRVVRQQAKLSTVYTEMTSMPIDKAYWAATSIEIADNTIILLQWPHKFLVMIADQINFGKNVTITWQRETKEIPPQLPPPPQAPFRQPPTAAVGCLYGLWGNQGTHGETGGPGPQGDPGPEIEIWTLDLQGKNPLVDIAGQDGFDGGRGQDGGRGGQGQNGAPCGDDSRAGSGGPGGSGGNAGNGGAGGNGGHGGRFIIFAPGKSILGCVEKGFYMDASGGARGRGGPPGQPGLGGYGGQKGRCADSSGHRGAADYSQVIGPSGNEGSPGPDGEPGGHHSDALSLVPIDEGVFRIQFEKPAIINLSKYTAVEGDEISVFSERLTASDVVTVGGIESPTRFESDTLLSFTVPAVEGGEQIVQIRQQDGTLSNRDTLVILPVVHHAEQQQNGNIVRSTDVPPGKFIPGSQVTLVGSGFASGAYVRVLGHYIAESDVEFVDSHTIVFKLIRPSSTPTAPDEGDATGDAGEQVDVCIVLATAGEFGESNQIPLQLDTFKMVVFGDSITWGQGLQEGHKFHSIVEQYIKENKPEIGVYKVVRAHSGAVIGVGRNQYKCEDVNGEIPRGDPTILKQIEFYGGASEAVDLILIDGGINDVGVNEIVNPIEPLLPDFDIARAVQQHCYDDMITLLQAVTDKFKNTKIVVTGYYQIVSEDSDIEFLTTWLTLGLGIIVPVGYLVGEILTAAAKANIVEHCRIFTEEANAKLQMAVDQINAEENLDIPRVLFAKPDFRQTNAIFGRNSYLWGFDDDLSPQDTTEAGGVYPQRAYLCETIGSSCLSSEFECKRASIGHPNVRGAIEYAWAIKRLSIL